MIELQVNSSTQLFQRVELVTDRESPFTACRVWLPKSAEVSSLAGAQATFVDGDTKIASGIFSEFNESRSYWHGYLLDEAEKLKELVTISHTNRTASALASDILTQVGVRNSTLDLPQQVLRHFHIFDVPAHEAMAELIEVLASYGHDTATHRFFCDAEGVLRVGAFPGVGGQPGAIPRLSLEEHIIRRHSDRIEVMAHKAHLRHSQEFLLEGEKTYAQRTRLILSADTHLLEVFPKGASTNDTQKRSSTLQLGLVRSQNAAQGTVTVEIVKAGSLKGTGDRIADVPVSQKWAKKAPGAFLLPAVDSYVLLGYIESKASFPVLLQSLGHKDALEITNGTISLKIGENNTLKIANSTESLRALLDAIADTFMQIQTAGSPAKQFSDPSMKLSVIEPLKKKIGGLLG